MGKDLSDSRFKNITVEMPVLGFTGALGSGCSYLAKGLADQHGYAYCSLSELIHTVAREARQSERTESLQDIGNRIRRQCGRDALVTYALTALDGTIPKLGAHNRPRGIVVDGIRNAGEAKALRQFPNFYLFSIQASTEQRKTRTIGTGPGFKFKDDAEFSAADRRDRDEQDDYKQQVGLCNYLADIIIRNEPTDEVAPSASKPYRTYVDKKLYSPYVALIEQLAEGRFPNDRRAPEEEALMTAAYVESKRSSCLKRKVGAVIAGPAGEVIAAGHNDVPPGSQPCLEDPRYGWCARDVIQQTLAEEFRFCPACGTKISIPEHKCEACGQEVRGYRRRCSNEACGASIEFHYECPQCRIDVFKEFLPGGKSDKTGKLLDMCRSLHAEESAILHLCRGGTQIPPQGCTLYCTTFPCNLCANKIAVVGIKRVVYAEPYTMEEAETIFRREGVHFDPFEGVKSHAYFRLYR